MPKSKTTAAERRIVRGLEEVAAFQRGEIDLPDREVGDTQRFEMLVSPAWLTLLDAWRRGQPDLPSRSRAVRELVLLGLEAKECGCRRTAYAVTEAGRQFAEAAKQWLEPMTMADAIGGGRKGKVKS